MCNPGAWLSWPGHPWGDSQCVAGWVPGLEVWVGQVGEPGACALWQLSKSI